jgi:hypothetical protein
MAETDQQLRTLLRSDPPASVSALPAEVRADLVEVIADARGKQAADLQRAFDDALKHVPFPVRGIVKKIVLG